MLYFLSKIIPVRMKTKYWHGTIQYRATWWQWRSHIFWRRVQEVFITS